ncbi:ANTAR domain-containing protein [Rathayibacter sp. VKM Ac-2804]|uniref:ANTAR domain-containing protein n=1 Tax=unclassified Rathayibacter TaxID=2609250 RepID=UPI00132F0879|nr:MULTISPECIES: ANTAR domain-containing protein [unclassified Rathayibacter]NRG39511.1 ANTAR domain-containing protein [Rathayibacter sp. VKM Ac-2835]QHF24242.1 ANTAR domain-containing protein [Rathayibacter sp. VKM Ac-2804]
MPEDSVDGVFVAWVESLPDVTDEEAAVLQAVGFLSASLRISADLAFVTLRAEADASGLGLPTVAREVLGHQRSIVAPRSEGCPCS